MDKLEKKLYMKEYHKEYRIYNKEKIDLIGKIWRENNQDRIIKYREEHRNKAREYNRQWAINNKDYYLLKQYGITHEEFKRILISQNNLCAICNKNLNERRWMYLDHCHNTNKVRGILCFNCNTAIGSFRDSIDLLKNAIKYLEKSYVTSIS